MGADRLARPAPVACGDLRQRQMERGSAIGRIERQRVAQRADCGGEAPRRQIGLTQQRAIAGVARIERHGGFRSGDRLGHLVLAQRLRRGAIFGCGALCGTGVAGGGGGEAPGQAETAEQCGGNDHTGVHDFISPLKSGRSTIAKPGPRPRAAMLERRRAPRRPASATTDCGWPRPGEDAGADPRPGAA